MSQILISDNSQKRRRPFWLLLVFIIAVMLVASPLMSSFNSLSLFVFAFIPAIIFGIVAKIAGYEFWLEFERDNAARRSRRGYPPFGAAPRRDAISEALEKISLAGGASINRFLTGFDLFSGDPVWLDDALMLNHICAFSKTSSEKTAWLEGLIFQQLARSQAHAVVYIDCKSDSGSLNNVIRIAQSCGRIDDLVVIDPQQPVHRYNLMQTMQSADLKASKILKIGLPDGFQRYGSNEEIKLASDYIFRIVRIFEGTGLGWSLKDISAVLADSERSFEYLRRLFSQISNRQSFMELVQLEKAAGNRVEANITKILEDISSKLSSFADSPLSESFCNSGNDFTLSAAMQRGKIIYFKVPSHTLGSESETAQRAFREDLKISMAEIATFENSAQKDPCLILIDADSSRDLTVWSSLIDAAGNRPFSLLFGAAFEAKSEVIPYSLDRDFCKKILAQTGFQAFLDLDADFDAQELSQKINQLQSLSDAAETATSNENAALRPFDIQVFEPSSGNFVAWFKHAAKEPISANPLKLSNDLPEGWDGKNFINTFQNQGLDGIGIYQWLFKQRQKA